MDWQDFVDLIDPGEPVTAGVANRPLLTLDNNVRFLWEFIQAANLGSAVYARKVPMASSLQIGEAVYWNHVSGQFEPAYTSVSPLVGSGGAVELNPTGQVWGIVAKKASPTATIGDVLLYGYATLNISNAIAPGESLQAGTYRLTSLYPGKLTRNRMPINVNVLRYDGSGKVFVCPQLTDLINDHQHFRFSLTCLPAGTVTPPAPGNRHVIQFPDSTKPGWLPANHAIFGGNAPTDAVFGYNLSAHQALQSVWPPLPLDHVYLEWDKGTDSNVGGTAVPLGPEGLCVIDEHGIWWMSDCYGDVPWPVNSTGSPEPPDPPGVECPRSLHMTMNLWFTKVFFGTESSWVRSLRSNDPRIQVTKLDGSPGQAGDLKLSLQAGSISGNSAQGHLVVKNINSGTLSFERGPVAEAVYTTSPELSISSTDPSIRNIGGTDRTIHQGLVRIDLTSSLQKELTVQLIRLDAVEEQFFEQTTYLGFPPGVASSIRCKLYIPDNLGPGTFNLRLRFWILGRSAGTLPNLTITARKLPRPPSGLTTPVNLPNSTQEFNVVCPTSAVLTAANQYVEAESNSFSVSSGDTVFYTVARSPSDGYLSEVGIITQKGILVT